MGSHAWCHGIKCVVPRISLWKSSPPIPQSRTVFGDQVFKRVIKLRTFGEALTQRLVSLPEENSDTDMSGHRHKGETARGQWGRWPSASQGQRLQKKPVISLTLDI